ncbi:MAG: hemerythrin domain-containing protein [Ignavibacteria bacterium]|nr:hemerythrin domain-containing protein [Ignavibacteria bacterium]
MPIRRNPAIVRFSRDHHFGLLLVWKIREGFRRSIEAERISLYVTKFFENELVPHFRDEEENLFARLPEDDKMRLQAENDHKKLNELIEHLMNNGNDEIMLSEFADLLEKHIRFEERELFNFIQESLTAAELAEIESAHAPAKCSTDSEWKDVFWN